MAKRTPEQQGTRNQLNLYFDNPEMDFNTQLILGYGAADGAAVGEVLYTISQIDGAKLETWAPAWLEMAQQIEAKAKTAAASGHTISARDALLRAATYYRAAIFGLGLGDPRLESSARNLRRCFAEAATRFNPPFEPVRIPFEDTTLPGYFLKPADDDKKRPTLVMIGGGETYNEELYFYIGHAGLKRGWNMLLIDLPGQGWTVHQGMTYRYDTEAPFRAIINYLEERADVDPERMVSYGISLGGYLVLRAAAYEKRLAAIALSTPMPDVHQWAVDGLPLPVHKLPRFMGDALTKLAGHFEPATRIAIEKWLAAVGTDSFKEALDLFKHWTVDVSQVGCPTLSILGEGEGAMFNTQTQQAYDALNVPKHLRVTTVAEGADGHCQANNLPLSHSIVFDWFEATLGL